MKPKIFQLKKFPMDMARVILGIIFIPTYRVKKYYLSADIKAEIKSFYGTIIAANHRSFADPFILNSCFWYRRFHFTASEQVMRGIRGKLLTGAGCIEIDRTITDFEAVKKCVNVLKSGWPLGMFPQGGINRDEVKGGVALIAAMAGVPIVPTYIAPREHWWQRTRVIFGKPIHIGEICTKKLPGKQDIDTICEVMKERYEACIQYDNELKK